MKKIVLLFVLCISMLVSSCSLFEDTTQEAKDEFSKYYNGKNDVVLIYGDVIYFEKYELDLNKLKEKEEANNGLIIRSGKIYFSTSKENSAFNYTLNIYETDLSGANIELLFSKTGYTTHPWAYAINDSFYIEHHLETVFQSESKRIDHFTLDSYEYKNIAQGKDSSLSNYIIREEPSKYNVEVIDTTGYKDPDRGKFIITDTETGEQRIIDDSYLQNTVYIESMQKFAYSVERCDISNGHILLSYGIGAGDGWNYAHLVFDYNFEDDTLEYKLLAFPDDRVGVDIVYIGE